MEECECRGHSEKEEDRNVKCRNGLAPALNVTLQYEAERKRRRGGGRGQNPEVVKDQTVRTDNLVSDVDPTS